MYASIDLWKNKAKLVCDEIVDPSPPLTYPFNKTSEFLFIFSIFFLNRVLRKRGKNMEIG